jgi:hypothetical protein
MDDDRGRLEKTASVSLKVLRRELDGADLVTGRTEDRVCGRLGRRHIRGRCGRNRPTPAKHGLRERADLAATPLTWELGFRELADRNSRGAGMDPRSEGNAGAGGARRLGVLLAGVGAVARRRDALCELRAFLRFCATMQRSLFPTRLRSAIWTAIASRSWSAPTAARTASRCSPTRPATARSEQSFTLELAPNGGERGFLGVPLSLLEERD